MRITAKSNRNVVVGNAPIHRRIRVLQHNVLHWTKARKYLLSNQYLAMAPDVILINAHGNKDDDRIKLFPYIVYQQNRAQQRHDGVAIAVRCNLRHTVNRDYDSETMSVTLETAQGYVTIATSYLPPSRPYLPVRDFTRLANMPHPVYLLGDLNARHRIFGYASANALGNQMADVIGRGTWTHLGPRFKTFHSYSSATTPDLVLSNRHAYWTTRIEPGLDSVSDHVSVLTTISADPLVSQTAPRFNYRGADWDLYRERITAGIAELQLDGQPVAAIDEAVEDFYRIVQEAKEAAIPKTTRGVKFHAHRSPTLIRLEGELRTLREEAERTFWDRNKYATMKRLQRDLIAEGKRLQGERWGELLEEIVDSHKDPKRFWACVNKLRGTNATPSDYLLDRSGPRPVKVSEPAAQEALMRREWEPTFCISDQENADFNPAFEARIEQELADRDAEVAPFDNVDLSRLDEANPAASSIIPEDIARTIKSFKNGKAPGPSGLNKTDLSNLPPAALQHLAKVFTASLSAGYFPHKFKHARMVFIPKSGKSPKEPLNYRPISLLETPGKVFEKILNERVVDYAEANNIHDPQQYGFRPGRGTTKAIALAYETVANAVALENGNATIIMRDIAKAFDKVWHPGLKHRLLEVGMPDLLRRTASHFLDGRTASIRMRGVEGPAFPLVTGVPRGSCLSPSLFIIYTDDTPAPDPRSHSTHFSYADDHNQVVTYPFRFPQGTARNN